MANNENMQIFDWDSEVEYTESQEFETLEPGDYEFSVVDFDKQHYAGSDKIPECPMAVITLEVMAPDGRKTRVFDRIYMISTWAWKISQFFVSIGMMKKGETIKPNWANVLGQSGYLSLDYNKGKKGEEEKYMNSDGTYKYNAVKKYLEPEAVNVSKQPERVAPARSWR